MSNEQEDVSKVLVGVLTHLTQTLTTVECRRVEVMRRRLSDAIWTARVATVLARIVAGEELDGIDVNEALNTWKEQGKDVDDAS